MALVNALAIASPLINYVNEFVAPTNGSYVISTFGTKIDLDAVTQIIHGCIGEEKNLTNLVKSFLNLDTLQITVSDQSSCYMWSRTKAKLEDLYIWEMEKGYEVCVEIDCAQSVALHTRCLSWSPEPLDISTNKLFIDTNDASTQDEIRAP